MQPRADSFKNERVRAIDNGLHRLRPGIHGDCPRQNLLAGRQVWQMQVSKHVGGAELRRSQLLLQRQELSAAECQCNDSADAVAIEAGSKLPRRVLDHARAKTLLVTQDRPRGSL